MQATFTGEKPAGDKDDKLYESCTENEPECGGTAVEDQEQS